MSHLRRSLSEAQGDLQAHHQGCAEIGVCYPPLSQMLTVALPALSASPAPSTHWPFY
ncbi:MAG: hypothetical protein U1F42_05550 [Candidatus Competibacteraceae bacterium]